MLLVPESQSELEGEDAPVRSSVKGHTHLAHSSLGPGERLQGTETDGVITWVLLC